MTLDVLTRVTPRQMSITALLANVVWVKVCERWEHRWEPFGRPLPFGVREYCSRCERQRLTHRDGEVVEFTKAEVLAADPGMAEELYELRWGDRPRQKLVRGEWPAV